MISAERLGERYLAVHHRMHRAADERMTASGLSLARTKVLRQLQSLGPTRPGVLAVQCGVVPHSITDIVDALERDGLVARQPDPADRRAKLIALTERGTAALVTAAATRERLLNQLFGVLGRAEREQLDALLGRLDAALEELLAGSPDDCLPVTSAASSSTSSVSSASSEGNGPRVIA
jgi:DNA-binding MarR family transcriptional regulator